MHPFGSQEVYKTVFKERDKMSLQTLRPFQQVGGIGSQSVCAMLGRSQWPDVQMASGHCMISGRSPGVGMDSHV